MREIPHIANKVFVFGGNHHNTLGIIRSVGEVGFRPIVLLEPCNKKFCTLRFSKYIDTIHYLSSTENALDILLSEYQDENNKGIIICASDSAISFLDKHLDTLEKSFIFFNAGHTQGNITRLLDKPNTFPIAEQCGFSLIKTWPKSKEDNIPADISYPCLIKGCSSLSSEKSDMHICKDASELQSMLNPDVDYLIQEFIEKDSELNIVGFAYNNGNDIIIPGVIYKIRETIDSQSEYFRVEDINDYPEILKTATQRFIKAIEYEGIFSIELIRKDEKFYFLEINLRNDATGYLFTKTGANYPLFWTLYSAGHPIENYLPEYYRFPLTLMQITDFKNVIKRNISIFKWLKEAITADTHFILNSHDIKPFLYQIYIPFRQLIKKPFHLIKK